MKKSRIPPQFRQGTDEEKARINEKLNGNKAKSKTLRKLMKMAKEIRRMMLAYTFDPGGQLLLLLLLLLLLEVVIVVSCRTRNVRGGRGWRTCARRILLLRKEVPMLLLVIPGLLIPLLDPRVNHGSRISRSDAIIVIVGIGIGDMENGRPMASAAPARMPTVMMRQIHVRLFSTFFKKTFCRHFEPFLIP